MEDKKFSKWLLIFILSMLAFAITFVIISALLFGHYDIHVYNPA